MKGRSVVLLAAVAAAACAAALSAGLPPAGSPRSPARAADSTVLTRRPVAAPAKPAEPRISPTRARLDAAAAYGRAAGYTVGIAIVDTASGAALTAGTDTTFATESVAKLFIAARLLTDGAMTGDTAATGYRMITQSDDDAANALYAQVGGDELIGWVEQHYHLPHLGTGPAKPGFWGLNHVRPSQLVQLLLRLRHDPRVWPWLGNAMSHATRRAADGHDQSFGIRQVDPHAAVKQGWHYDWSLPGTPAQLNTTGFVDGGRYAVVIMVRGPKATYFAAIAHAVTEIARIALTGTT